MTTSHLDNNGDVERYSYQFNNPKISSEPLVMIDVDKDRRTRGFSIQTLAKIMGSLVTKMPELNLPVE